jgi:IS4 transposase
MIPTSHGIIFALEIKALSMVDDSLPHNKFSSQEVIKLYPSRWQIELLFNEFKSDRIPKIVVTRQPLLVEGLIWASLLSLPIKRYIDRVAQRRFRMQLFLINGQSNAILV